MDNHTHPLHGSRGNSPEHRYRAELLEKSSAEKELGVPVATSRTPWGPRRPNRPCSVVRGQDSRGVILCSAPGRHSHSMGLPSSMQTGTTAQQTPCHALCVVRAMPRYAMLFHATPASSSSRAAPAAALGGNCRLLLHRCC